jgi:hypothetical protein
LSDRTKLLLKHAFVSILKDYANTAPDDLTGALYELMAAGFRFHDLSHDPDAERRGIFIAKREGDNLKEIAFVSMLRERCDGVYVVDIYRFDRNNRVDTLEVQKAMTWN